MTGSGIKRGLIMGLVSRYDRALREKPLVTKCVSSGIIMGTCELVSQTILHQQQQQQQ